MGLRRVDDEVIAHRVAEIDDRADRHVVDHAGSDPTGEHDGSVLPGRGDRVGSRHGVRPDRGEDDGLRTIRRPCRRQRSVLETAG